MTTTHFAYPELRALRLEIDGAVQECHGSYLADAQRLARFCDKGARALESFQEKTASMVDPATAQQTATESGAEELQLVLKKIILHIKRRSRTAIAANVMRESVLRQTVGYDTTTASGLEDELREVVLLYYVDPVARDVERAMGDSSRNTTLQLRSKRTQAVTLLYALNDLDDVLRFGGRPMREYERRLSHARTLDEISRNTISLLNFHKLLGKQVSQLCHEIDAVRKRQGRDTCPRVFFVVPADKTKLSRIERAMSFNLFTKNMHLYFVCRMFLEDLRKSLPSTRPTDTTCEFSDPLDIKQPREFVKSWGPAVRLSLKVVQMLGHAAAIGFGAGQLIPNLSLADHDSLFEMLQTDLETLTEEIEVSPPTTCHEENGKHSSSSRPIKLDDEGAHEAMQGYLEEKHKGEWRSKVFGKLQLVELERVGLREKAGASMPTDAHEFGYVCKENPYHRPL